MTKVGFHEGHTISLNDRHRFIVSGSLFDDDDKNPFGYATWDDAVKEINDRKVRAVKEKTVNVSLPVIKEDGSGKVTIKGIHSRLGNLLFTDAEFSKEASERYGRHRTVYPDVPWIQDLLVEMAELQKRAGVIRDAIQPYGIALDYARMHVGKMEKYSAQIDKLVAEHAEKLAAAIKTNDRGQKGESV